jgi:hypothetical protein
MLEQTQDEIAIAILKKLHKSERTLPAAVSGALIQSSNGANSHYGAAQGGCRRSRYQKLGSKP